MTESDLPLDTSSPADAWPQDSLPKAVWHSVKYALRIMAYFALPFSYVFTTLFLLPTALGLGAGYGLGLSRMAIHSLVAFCLFEAWAAVFGAIIGFLAFMLNRFLKILGRRPWKSSGRPISFIPARWKKPAAAAKPLKPGRVSKTGRLLLFLRLGGGMLLSLVVAFAVGVYAGSKVNRELDEAIAEADASDPNWRFNDLMATREILPDEENSAVIVAEAADRLPADGWPSNPDRKPEGSSRPMSEAHRGLEALHKSPNNVQLDPVVLKVFREEMSRYDDAVQIALKAAEYRRGHHELEIPDDLLAIPLVETQRSRYPTRLLEAYASVQANDGEIDASLDACRAIFGISRSIGDEPTIISFLVRAAIENVAITAAQHALGQGEASDEALADLQQVILDALDEPILIPAMKGERATYVEMIRRIRDGEIPIDTLGENKKPGKPFDPPGSWNVLWYDYQSAVMLKWLNAIVEIASKPVVERPPLWNEWNKEFQRVKDSKLERILAILPLLLTPAIQASSDADDRRQSLLGASAILLAAERQRLKTGTWPNFITEIDPMILENPPVDPHTGKPFLITRKDGQFIVHSAGPNLKDEQGAYDYKAAANFGTSDDIGTSAWDVPLRKQPPAPPDNETKPAS